MSRLHDQFFEAARESDRMRHRMRILLVGHGRMGRLVGELAGEYECEVAGIVDPASAAGGRIDDDRWSGVDVAIDFSMPDAVPENVPALARRGMTRSCGTTGWSAHEPALRRPVAGERHRRRRGPELLGRGGACSRRSWRAPPSSSARRPTSDAWLHEAHHEMKKDAPSGTALLLKRAMEAGRLSAADRRVRPPGRATFRACTPSVSTARRNRLRCRIPRATAARSRAARCRRPAG